MKFYFFKIKFFFLLIIVTVCGNLLSSSQATQVTIDKLYKEFESECSKFCYTESFRRPNETEAFKEIIRNNVIYKRGDQKKSNIKFLNDQKQLPAYENAVLISMVKDEEDVIYENLCWHYFMGFRKFVIVDNGSTDSTGQLIDRFKDLTKSFAVVIKINDSEVSFKQASRLNACCKVAETLFPQITWVFPNDADEFIVFDESIESTLSKIPFGVNCIYSQRLWYFGANDYFDFPQEAKFYESIHRFYQPNSLSLQGGKTFIKAHQGLFIMRGFHFASLDSLVPQFYISGSRCNVHIREFPLRSPAQVIKKFINRSKALKVLENDYTPEVANIAFNATIHSRADRYSEVGDLYGMEEFKASLEQSRYFFDERMPIDLAIRCVESLSLAGKDA